MNKLTLTRKKDTGSKGTPGSIQIESDIWYTIEQPWNGNKPYHSCLPDGLYELIPWNSTEYGHCYVAVNEQLNVFFSFHSPNRPDDGRFKCLFFHKGNYPHNFEGCGGVGEKYLPDMDMVTNTVQTCRIVNSLIAEKEIKLLEIVTES